MKHKYDIESFNIIMEHIFNRNKIATIFFNNVKCKKFENTKNRHDGKEGHWLENLFGLKHNSDNKPDIYGYELKKSSKKITFGDYSASEYLFSKKNENIMKINNLKNEIITREEFIKIFGEVKKNKCSWSGSCFPKYGVINECGQTICVDKENNIIIKYYFTKDNRVRKIEFPEFIKNDGIVLAIWYENDIKSKINNKFNDNGFVICNKDNEGNYESISFGGKFDFNLFIENFKKNKIILDSGMKCGNSRNYSHFRANEKFWQSMIRITI